MGHEPLSVTRGFPSLISLADWSHGAGPSRRLRGIPFFQRVSEVLGLVQLEKNLPSRRGAYGRSLATAAIEEIMPERDSSRGCSTGCPLSEVERPHVCDTHGADDRRAATFGTSAPHRNSPAIAFTMRSMDVRVSDLGNNLALPRLAVWYPVASHCNRSY